MNERTTFIGTFAIPDRDAWLAAISEMTAFVEARVPQGTRPRVQSLTATPRAGRRTSTPWGRRAQGT